MFRIGSLIDNQSKNEAALDRYFELRALIEMRLERISDSLLDRVSPEDVRWGHVGNLNHIADELGNLCDFAGVPRG